MSIPFFFPSHGPFTEFYFLLSTLALAFYDGHGLGFCTCCEGLFFSFWWVSLSSPGSRGAVLAPPPSMFLDPFFLLCFPSVFCSRPVFSHLDTRRTTFSVPFTTHSWVFLTFVPPSHTVKSTRTAHHPPTTPTWPASSSIPSSPFPTSLPSRLPPPPPPPSLCPFIYRSPPPPPPPLSAPSPPFSFSCYMAPAMDNFLGPSTPTAPALQRHSKVQTSRKLPPQVFMCPGRGLSTLSGPL